MYDCSLILVNSERDCGRLQQAFSLTINSRSYSGREVGLRKIGVRNWAMQKMRQILAQTEEQNPWNAAVTRATFDEDSTYSQAKCVNYSRRIAGMNF